MKHIIDTFVGCQYTPAHPARTSVSWCWCQAVEFFSERSWGCINGPVCNRCI